MISLTILALAIGVAAQVPAQLNPVEIEAGNNAGKCLTAASNVNGAAVTIQQCTGATSQLWSFAGGSSGAVSVFGSKCLDVTGGSNTNGNLLQIWDCSVNNNPNQNWFFTGNKRLSWTNKGKCMDLTGGSLANGNKIQIWTCSSGNPNQVWNVGYDIHNLPETSEKGQTGINKCGTTSSQQSHCQTAYINGVDDFCLWAPPKVGTIGDTERNEVAWCSKSGRGTRTFPAGTLKGVHFVTTPNYVQVTGVGDFTKINIPKGDSGGELDPHGADGNGNPIGGLVFGNTFGANVQYHEWTSFISDTEFCFRACTGPDAAKNCNHIYDVLGCFWNMPANYDSGTFETCKGDNDLPMGIYGSSTFHQGQSSTPPPHPIAPSSDCTKFKTVSVSPAVAKRDIEYVRRAPEPSHLAAM